MGGEKIFGSCKWKPDLLPCSEGDSHKHDRVNFSYTHVLTPKLENYIHNVSDFPIVLIRMRV